MRIFQNQFKEFKQIVKPAYYECKDFFDLKLKTILKSNFLLKNKFQGQRCFLLLPGASIEHINLEQLRNEYTMGLNLFYLHKEIEKLDLKMHFMSSNHFLLNKNMGMDKEYHKLLSCENLDPIYKNKLLDVYRKRKERSFNIFSILDNSLNNNALIFAESNNYSFFQQHSLFNKKSVYYYSHFDYIASLKNTNNHNKIDFTKRIKGGGSAFSNAILLLIYMGFTEILLCGEGYTYNPIYEFHFYDNFNFAKTTCIKDASREAEALIQVRNIELGQNLKFYGFNEKGDSYKPIYTRDFQMDSSNAQVNSFINAYAESVGVKIINIVPDGFESSIFRKISWKEVLKTIKI